MGVAEFAPQMDGLGKSSAAADSYEQATWFGDDIALRRDIYTDDLIGMNKARFAMRHAGAGRPPVQRMCAAQRQRRNG
jgi:hypothetical protein